MYLGCNGVATVAELASRPSLQKHFVVRPAAAGSGSSGVGPVFGRHGRIFVPCPGPLLFLSLLLLSLSINVGCFDRLVK